MERSQVVKQQQDVGSDRKRAEAEYGETESALKNMEEQAVAKRQQLKEGRAEVVAQRESLKAKWVRFEEQWELMDANKGDVEEAH